jgi:glycosyltransferase involved in cell wall biosynthesis
MRILMLSWYFPPINEIGAVRVGKLAEYLYDRGHEVWVVTSRREAEDQSLTLALPAERVIRSDWIDLDYLSSPWQWFRTDSKGPAAQSDVATTPTAEFHESLRGILGRNYMWLVRFPDQRGGWLPYLHHAASQLMNKRKFDLIYASAPPFTALVGAARLSRRFGVPWIAEYRDAWTQNHYTPKPVWRENLDVLVENRTTRSASGIVAVSDPWTDHYLQRFRKPAIAIYNGFDPVQQTANPSTGTPGLPVTIVHMGTIYWGLRDPSLLFDAIKIAGVTPDEVQVAFYGATPGAVLPRAAGKGVQDFVKVPARVPYQRALELQRISDVLLLL